MTNFQLKSLMGALAGLDIIPLDEAVGLAKKLGNLQVPATVEKIALQVLKARKEIAEEKA